jgi:S-formylglutathione hydrolase FrmB
MRRNESDDQLKPVTDDKIEEYVKRHCALLLAENMPVDELKSVRWYIDCGDDDFLYEGNSLVPIAMRKREIPHEFRVRDGGPRWSYWRSALPAVLSFVSESFHQNQAIITRIRLTNQRELLL